MVSAREDDPLPLRGSEPREELHMILGSGNRIEFTLEQVDRGQYEFSVVCEECHSTSEFRGQNFEFSWRRRTAWDFYRTVTQTMPENAPGSLMDEQYVDVIAYILEMNGFEPGDAELPATKAAREQFPMDGAPTR